MKLPMTFHQLEVFSASFQGDRSQISFEDGELIFPDALEAEVTAIDLSNEDTVLASLKLALIVEVNSEAETQRKKYITPGEGQAMTYTEKLAQARAFLAATAPDPADFPMIANEIGITAPTASGVAEAVVAEYTAWATIGTAIEGVRMRTKKSISDAADADTARALRVAVVWP